MKKGCWLLILAFALWACTNSQKEPEVEVMDSIDVARQVVSEDSTLSAEKGLPNWINNNLKTGNAAWNFLQLESFWNQDTLGWAAFAPAPTFYNDYKNVLRWAPDSNYVLDLGSYGSVVITDQQGNTSLEGGDPDTEIALIDTKTGKRARLLFAGPSTHIINGTWLDTSQVMMIGTFDKGPAKRTDTLVWMVDVKEKFFRLYNYKKP